MKAGTAEGRGFAADLRTNALAVRCQAGRQFALHLKQIKGIMAERSKQCAASVSSPPAN